MDNELRDYIWDLFNKFHECGWTIMREMSQRDQTEFVYHLDMIAAMFKEKYGGKGDEVII